MKNIKQFVVGWLIFIFSCITLNVKSQDSYTITHRKDTIVFESAMKILFKTEPLDKNQALKAIIELESEETEILNSNLSNLNKTIKELPELNIQAKEAVLEKYGVNPYKISKRHRNISVSFYALMFMYLTILGLKFNVMTKLYWTKKSRINMLMQTSFGILLIYILYKMMISSIDGYYIWSGIDKLF
jgi:hypothetical protein